MQLGLTAFIHFIGSCRFKGGVYARLGREVIAALQRTAAVPPRLDERPFLDQET
jgi:hypothetical protein